MEAHIPSALFRFSGGFDSNNYWSSSEDSEIFGGDICVFLIDLSDGSDMPSVSTNEHYIRPVRAF